MIQYIEQLDLNKSQCPYAEISNFEYNLFPEQLQVLYLMKKLEQQEFIYKGDKKIYYNKIRLGAPFSFGFVEKLY